jgi:hypothetical protein
VRSALTKRRIGWLVHIAIIRFVGLVRKTKWALCLEIPTWAGCRTGQPGATLGGAIGWNK